MEIKTFRSFFRLSLPSEIQWYSKLVYVVIYFSSQTLLFLSIRLLTNLYICNYIFMIDDKKYNTIQYNTIQTLCPLISACPKIFKIYLTLLLFASGFILCFIFCCLKCIYTSCFRYFYILFTQVILENLMIFDLETVSDGLVVKFVKNFFLENLFCIILIQLLFSLGFAF